MCTSRQIIQPGILPKDSRHLVLLGDTGLSGLTYVSHEKLEPPYELSKPAAPNAAETVPEQPPNSHPVTPQPPAPQHPSSLRPILPPHPQSPQPPTPHVHPADEPFEIDPYYHSPFVAKEEMANRWAAALEQAGRHPN